MKIMRVTTETVEEVIYRYINECGENRFTTTDISRLMGADEYQVRAAIRWLHDHGKVEPIQGLRSCRYTNTSGEKYSAAVYQIRQQPQVDFVTLNRVFCGG